MDLGVLALLFIGGCAGGLLAGLLGVGGGLVFVVIFTNYLTTVAVADSKIAQLIIANSMIAIFFAGVSGSIRHYVNGHFYFKPVLISGFMASVASVATTYVINHTSWYNKELFSIIFISITAFIAYSIFTGKSAKETDGGTERFSVIRFLQIGALGGTLAALSGVGGGIIMVPMLIRILKINIKKATAISLGIITVMALVSSVYSLVIKTNIPVSHSYGLIIFPMVIPVAIGCVICSPFGVALAQKIPARTIQIIFAAFLVLVTLNMIYTIWL